MKDKIMQWFVRLIRLDMGYVMLENEERHRCYKIYNSIDEKTSIKNLKKINFTKMIS